MYAQLVEAGADVITTNSYALVPFHIGVERFASEGVLLAARAGQLARDVADASSHSVRVAGSLPPVCGSYRPDLVDLDRARPILNVLIGALAPNVDHWLAETLSSLPRLAKHYGFRSHWKTMAQPTPPPCAPVKAWLRPPIWHKRLGQQPCCSFAASLK